jgi:glycosyl transferase family 25
MRFNAIEDDPGCLGCSRSHIAVLEMAIQNNWNNVLVLEDDVEWNDFDNNYSRLKKMVAKKYAVILLGGVCVYKYPDDRLISAQTTTGYLVNRFYYKRLLENFKESYNLLKDNLDKQYLFALDQYWKNLQKDGNWYVVSDPCMIYQKPDYSDIEKNYVDYRSAFRL